VPDIIIKVIYRWKLGFFYDDITFVQEINRGCRIINKRKGERIMLLIDKKQEFIYKNYKLNSLPPSFYTDKSMST